jgi:hypothetical protein
MPKPIAAGANSTPLRLPVGRGPLDAWMRTDDGGACLGAQPRETQALLAEANPRDHDRPPCVRDPEAFAQAPGWSPGFR